MLKDIEFGIRLVQYFYVLKHFLEFRKMVSLHVDAANFTKATFYIVFYRAY